MGGLTIIYLFYSALLFSILTTFSNALDTLAADETIRDGGDTITSAGGNFELGFFSPNKSSQNRYLGIWYKKISTGTVVWVANRETPLTSNTSGVLTVSSQGILQLSSGGSNGRVIWSSSNLLLESARNVSNPVAHLLDTGNLVIRDSKNGTSIIWQSFDHPVDTLLPGMKLGKGLVTGMEWNGTAWKSAEDPSFGSYKLGMDFNGYPQICIWVNGTVLHSRLGPWNGLGFSGLRSDSYNPIYTEEFVMNDKEIYYKYELVDTTQALSRMTLGPDGNIQSLNWIDSTSQGWLPYLMLLRDNCDRYGTCGAYGSCHVIDNSTEASCGCMHGFVPYSSEEWSAGNWSSGCRRKTSLNCGTGNGPDVGFLKILNVKVPDTQESWFNRNMSLADCETRCRNNCSCTGYGSLDVRGSGSGCLLWFGDLMDVKERPENGQDFYTKLAASELSGHKKVRRIVEVTLPTTLAVLLLGLALAVYAWLKKKKRSQLNPQGTPGQVLDKDYTTESQKEDADVPVFSFSKIAKATNNFSISNKLGQGGFGPVYKGVLVDGREIAVKRLSKTSRQGLGEFKNEIRSISRLQHRNLVKLLGYSVKGDEMILIYEYLPNKSLDSFIFDETRRSLLDWPRRFKIIQGIARGLLYLHQDSRLRIIHRDLKAGNILLDSHMNPKISDFGLARRFRGYETEANTNRVVGTYGYISPEYAANGLFSVKSDVFSFGVLVLEIVNGKKNRGFSGQDQHVDNLLGHAWRLFKERKSIVLIDTSLVDSCIVSEVLQSIHVGLLCVQQWAEDRPSMSSVVMMLDGEDALPPPKQPGFFTEGSVPSEGNNSSTLPTISVNDVTITVLEAR